MSDTTAAIQDYLRDLKNIRGVSAAEPTIRLLLARACGRLNQICGSSLKYKFPRLMQPPGSVEVEEVLDAAVERLIKALRAVRPDTPRQFFSLANKHIRYELLELARNFDHKPTFIELSDPAASEKSDTVLSPNAQRIFQAIDELPADQREAFELVKIQNLDHQEAAEVVGVAPRTIKRRVDRAVITLAENLSDLAPEQASAESSEPEGRES